MPPTVLRMLIVAGAVTVAPVSLGAGTSNTAAATHAPASGQAAAPTSTAASPASGGSVALEDLTWTDVRAAIAAGRTTIIIPIGGTEQNGPHIVLGKHNVRVRLLADRIAAALGTALVAPVVAYVPEGSITPPTAHMRFPGTITIPDAAFEATLASAARSFRQAGFRDVVLIGDHGGYQKTLNTLAQRLDREWAGAAHVHAVDAYYHAVEVEYPQALRQRGFTDAEIGSHAGLADTSLMLALDPAQVHPERLDAAASGGKAVGVSGDPRRSSAALGQIGVDLIVARTTAAVRAAVGAGPTTAPARTGSIRQPEETS